MIRGKYIVIEGPQGVGKTTQIQMVAHQLRSAGLPVRILREPDSQSDVTARAIRRLTQDKRYPMNSRTEVLLYNAARSQSLDTIEKNIAQGITSLVDRNYLSTLANQFYGRGDIPDYDAINEIIKFAVSGREPDLLLLLDVEVTVIIERMRSRYQSDRFDSLDEGFLDRVRAGYLLEAKRRNLPVIHAIDTPEEVFKQVWKYVTETMAQRNRSAIAEAMSVAEIIADKQEHVAIPSATAGDSRLVEKNNEGIYVITEEGKKYLSNVVTDVENSVYAFTDSLSPMTIAAAMARLSRRGDDMRVTILDEFANQLGKDEKLLQRVITAYGDDSVQQLAGQHVVVEGASNLLTKKLEWGRLAAYLEQSTRYIYYDKKDVSGKYKFFTPTNLKPSVRKRYDRDMSEIFDLYSKLVQRLAAHLKQTSTVPKNEQDGAWSSAIRAQACDAARPMLPVATKSTVGIYASGQALENLIMHLLGEELLEMQETGQKLLDETRKVIPILLERADKPDRGGATIAHRATTYASVRELSNKLLPKGHGGSTEAVQLTDVFPHNELDLIADMLYEHSDLSLQELRNTVSTWSYDEKVKVFKAYMGERLNRRHRPGRALEKAHYAWDLMSDYGIFRDLQRHRMVDDLEWQKLTPRYGYEIPNLVEEAGLADVFEQAFAISLELYSFLQAAGYAEEAQYATLLGHKMRWKLMYNAREAFHLHELRTSPQGHPGYRKLVQQMHEKLAEVHPLMAESMLFVNKGEDPELTRLAAEKYTQFKLSGLSK